MDTATATIIAAVIGASASITVALITTRAQIGGRQNRSGEAIDTSGHARIINERTESEQAPGAATSTPPLRRFISYFAIAAIYLTIIFFVILVVSSYHDIYIAHLMPVNKYTFPAAVFCLIVFLTLGVYFHRRLATTFLWRNMIFLLMIAIFGVGTFFSLARLTGFYGINPEFAPHFTQRIIP
jgi:hypothetical protein